MNLSRAVCRQLLAMDLVEGVVDAVRQADRHDVALDQILRRVSRLQYRIRTTLAVLNDQGGIVFESGKEYRRYQRVICQARDEFLACWSGEQLDGREYLSAVLLYLDEVWHQAERTRDDMGRLIAELGRIYEMMDPELCAEEQMDVGQLAGERLAGVMV